MEKGKAMELSTLGLKDRAQWEAKGYQLPQFDRAAVTEATRENPCWIHFGAGNIFRAFQANVMQNILNRGEMETGLIVAEGFDYEIIEKMNRPHDDYSILVTLKADGSVEKTVVGSVVESCILDSENEGEYGRLKEIFCKQSLQMVSFTITEKGYSLVNGKGELLPAEKEFVSYVNDREKVSFPWSMIDKITPRPDASVEEILKKDEIDGLDPVVTSKNTYVAPFVNAEECEYLVIEDWFPNGRPELEKGGIMFTDRATVDKVEKMKVCTCLNPLHTALAVFGCLLGYTKISDEMKDAELRKMVERIGYTEGLPVVVDPGILDPKEFIDTVLNVRIPNPFMPDTPQRIATDTSQKLAIRFGETVKNYLASKDKDIKNLKLIPLVFAGWLRYLMAVDDNGEKFELSPDPLLETVCPVVAGIKFGDTDVEETIRPLLTNRAIFGVDLYEAGLAGLTVQYFKELIAGVGAVRATLKKYV